jgi:hypothetical protein
VPVGGTTGQLPVKASGTDYDIAWTNPPIRGRETVDFGTRRRDATVTVSSPTVTTTSRIIASVPAVATASHSADEAFVEELEVRVGPVTAGVGFNLRVACRRGVASGFFYVDWIQLT